MTTWIPIHVCVVEKHGECMLWKLGKVTEYDLYMALRSFLIIGVVEDGAKKDFEWLVEQVAEVAKQLCEVTESQWFCIVSSKLKELVDQLYELKGEK